MAVSSCIDLHLQLLFWVQKCIHTGSIWKNMEITNLDYLPGALKMAKKLTVKCWTLFLSRMVVILAMKGWNGWNDGW